jgi:hypothetical protein
MKYDFLIYVILVAAIDLGIQLTKMNTRNRKIIMFLGSKVRPVFKADKLAAIC